MSVYHLFNTEQKKALLKEPLPNNDDLLLDKLFNQYSADDNLGRMLYMDTRSWLPDDLLTYGDKATMINAIEARVPILDKNLVYFIGIFRQNINFPCGCRPSTSTRRPVRSGCRRLSSSARRRGSQHPSTSGSERLEGYVRDQLLGGVVVTTIQCPVPGGDYKEAPVGKGELPETASSRF